jgi:hypothetical protein
MVTHITSAGLAAWIAFQKSSEIKLFNAYTLQQLAIVDVRPEVKRILQGNPYNWLSLIMFTDHLCRF